MIDRPAPLDGRRRRIVARLATERRHSQRVKLPLPGRYLTQNGREFPCEVIDISPGGLLVRASPLPATGERVVFMLAALGRLEGEAVRIDADSFAVRLKVSARKRDRLGDELTWLLNRDRLGLKDDRACRRIRRRNRVFVQTADGLTFTARAIDVSMTGMAIETSEPIRPGERIRVGRLDGVVVRLVENGIAVRFLPPEPEQETPRDPARPAPPPAAICDAPATPPVAQRLAKAQ